MSISTLLSSFQMIHLIPRSRVTYPNVLVFDVWWVLRPPNYPLADGHPSTSVCDCMLNIWPSDLHIWRSFSITYLSRSFVTSAYLPQHFIKNHQLKLIWCYKQTDDSNELNFSSVSGTEITFYSALCSEVSVYESNKASIIHAHGTSHLLFLVQTPKQCARRCWKQTTSSALGIHHSLTQTAGIWTNSAHRWNDGHRTPSELILLHCGRWKELQLSIPTDWKFRTCQTEHIRSSAQSTICADSQDVTGIKLAFKYSSLLPFYPFRVTLTKGRVSRAAARGASL